MSPERVVNFDLFGVEEVDLGRAKNAIERALGIAFAEHESSYLGSYYLAGLPGAEHFELRSNRDAEGELVEPEHESFPTLLYVNETNRPDELAKPLAAVEGIARLRSEELPC